jgi:ABC-2 type transport system permease protein
VSPFRLLAISRRIADGFRRDRPTLALLFVVPLVVTALLGWVLEGAQAAETRALVVDLDAGPLGPRLATALRSGAVEVDRLELAVSSDEDEAREDLRADRVDVVLVIPDTFSADMADGTAELVVVTQGANPGEEGGHLAELQRLFGRTLGVLAGQVGLHPPELVHRTVYGSPDADELDVFGPVFIGYFAYFFVFILTGISFLRERLGGTLERLLATPVTRAEIVLGYSLGFGVFATLQVAVLTTFAIMHVVLPELELPFVGTVGLAVGLDVASAGDPLVAFVIALVLALGAVNLGIFLSTFARTEFQVLQFIPVVIVPQGLLGGIFWPIETLPELLQPIARLMPITYAVEGLRGVMIKGWWLDHPTIQLDLAVLLAVVVFFVALAVRTIRREIA